MSLFENDEYRWRDTYFVLFESQSRPHAVGVEAALREMDRRYQLVDVRQNEDGMFESLTLLSPDDNTAMDITFMSGEEVAESLVELNTELKKTTLDPDQQEKAVQLAGCDARFDVFHFERLTFEFDESEEEEDEFMDPGALLIVLERMAEICQGVAVDPASNSLL